MRGYRVEVQTDGYEVRTILRVTRWRAIKWHARRWATDYDSLRRCLGDYPEESSVPGGMVYLRVYKC
jgi:hypothetical protein